MLLAFDVGNTNIVCGVYKDRKLIKNWRIATDTLQTADGYVALLGTLFHLNQLEFDDVEDIIISTVVPPIIPILETMSHRYFHVKPILVGPGIKTGLNILYDNPKELGADRIVNAVAAIAEYDCPLIIIDMGTATTISVVDDKKHYIGGMIMPGVQISLDALTTRASQLSGISIEEPKKIIGKNTIDCMKSGILYGNAAAVDGIIDRIEEELGQKVTVIATGGMSRKIIPHCKRKMILDGDLLLKGLQIVYEKNKA